MIGMTMCQHYLFHAPFADPGGRPRNARQDGRIQAHVYERIDVIQPARAAEHQVHLAGVDLAAVFQRHDSHSPPSTLRNNCPSAINRWNSGASSGGISCVCSAAKKPPGASARWNMRSTSILSGGRKWSSTFLHTTSEYA